jgi:hypothetical protein
MNHIRQKLEAALAKPIADDPDSMHVGTFDPWGDVLQGIYGGYASESDELMIATLKAVKTRTTFTLIDEKGFIVEFMLYVLAGHRLLDYGMSPRGGWPDNSVADLWDALIEKWEAHAKMLWS